jgi:hypothetical protein
MRVETKLLELYEEGKIIFELEKVINQCAISLQNRIIMEYPIKCQRICLQKKLHGKMSTL